MILSTISSGIRAPGGSVAKILEIVKILAINIIVME